MVEECSYLMNKFIIKDIDVRDDFMTVCPSKILLSDNTADRAITGK